MCDDRVSSAKTTPMSCLDYKPSVFGLLRGAYSVLILIASFDRPCYIISIIIAISSINFGSGNECGLQRWNYGLMYRLGPSVALARRFQSYI